MSNTVNSHKFVETNFPGLKRKIRKFVDSMLESIKMQISNIVRTKCFWKKTLIRYAQNRQAGKQNNLKLFGEQINEWA